MKNLVATTALTAGVLGPPTGPPRPAGRPRWPPSPHARHHRRIGPPSWPAEACQAGTQPRNPPACGRGPAGLVACPLILAGSWHPSTRPGWPTEPSPDAREARSAAGKWTETPKSDATGPGEVHGEQGDHQASEPARRSAAPSRVATARQGTSIRPAGVAGPAAPALPASLRLSSREDAHAPRRRAAWAGAARRRARGMAHHAEPRE